MKWLEDERCDTKCCLNTWFVELLILYYRKPNRPEEILSTFPLCLHELQIEKERCSGSYRQAVGFLVIKD